MISLLRLLTGAGDWKQLRLRLIGLAVLVVVLVIWGINYRRQLPPSGIMGDATLPPSMGDLEIGGSVSDSLEDDERHTWAFEGRSGQRVNVRVRGTWASNVELFPPSGALALASAFTDGDEGQSLICNQYLTESGTYTVIVSGAPQTGGQPFGDYELHIEAAAHIAERPITYGKRVEGRLTTCDGDFYTIAVEAGDQLQVTLTPEAGSVMYLRLLSSRNVRELLAFGEDAVDVDGNAAETITADILEAATLFLQVDTPDDALNRAYTLRVERLNDE